MNPIRAYHFVGDALRDGRPVPADGVKLIHTGRPVPCQSGLHASEHPFDALRYATGPILCLVDIGGEVVRDGDKIVGTERTIIERIDATDLLRYFARMQAISVIHHWPIEPPDCVLDYLMTGDEALRSAAWSAAWSAEAQSTAAWSEAWSATRAAARSAAWSAAWSAAQSAKWSAEARPAAWSAVRAAEWSAASTGRGMFDALVKESLG